MVLIALLLPPEASAETDLASLPAGPIRDRVELMEKIGAAAKKINEAAKAGNTQAAIAPAEEIARLTPKFAEMFPEGSTDPKSRANIVLPKSLEGSRQLSAETWGPYE